MNHNLIQEVHNKSITKKNPLVKPGYTVEVDTIIREGNKQRVQKFKGLVISVTGTGANQMMTVRKISYGVGVEKKLPLQSPNIGDIKVIKTEPTRRSKLYFMRSRVGKNAMRIKKGKAVFVTEDETQEEPMVNEEVELSNDSIETTVDSQAEEVQTQSSEETVANSEKSEEVVTAEPATEESKA